jgi:hypothetical protein
MIFYVKWLLVPTIVLASAFLFASLEWFHSEWFFAAYSVVGLFLMIIWRRATYRIEPSLRSLTREILDDRTKHLLTKCFFMTFGGVLTIDMIILFCLIIFSTKISLAGCGLLFFILFWSSISKFGITNLLAHNILVHALSNKDLPQNG